LAVQDRAMVVAVVISLLVHTPLLLAPGPSRVGPATAPVLEVRIEPLEGDRAIHDAPQLDDALSVVEALVAPQSGNEPEPEELRARSVPEPGRVVLESVDQLAADVALPTESIAMSLPAIAAEFATGSAGTGLPNDLGTPAVEAQVPADELPSTADPIVATIAPTEEAVLTQRLVREARELLGSGALQRNLTFEDDERRFSAALTRQPAGDPMGVERVTVDIVAERGGERMRTRMQMKRVAFSHFTQLVDRWDPSVQLHDDEIAGRFHSNSEIFLAYDRKVAPRLLGKVTTARGIRINEEKGWVSRRRIFLGGLETRSARIRLPRLALPAAQEQTGPDGYVHVVPADAAIVFHPDGNYECVELASSVESRRRLTTDGASYIIGAPDAELRVRGVVNGNVTVYSPKRIVIQDDLKYADEARSSLGLVSDGNVEIDGPEITGPGDLEVHAAIYARKRFVVTHPRARGRATLFIYGSLTAGSISETEPRYATRIEFDPRFERVRPPGFPETDQYEIETWDGRWQMADASLSE
jgi:hypothetical protein